MLSYSSISRGLKRKGDWWHTPSSPHPFAFPGCHLLSVISPKSSFYDTNVHVKTMPSCRYGAQACGAFSDWRQLVLHEAIMHEAIHSRIPCPADGCTKDYAQLKYLITHYNIHSGKLTRCPTCQKGYTDPSRASRCRQSHDRHFMCPIQGCDYSNARADLVKQHCKKKHPEVGELTTGQLASAAYPPSDAQSVFDASFTFQARSGSDNGDSDERPAPQLSRPELAQAAEMRRLHNVDQLRQSHIALSGLSSEQFDAAVPDYPFKEARMSYIQGPSDSDMFAAPLTGSSVSSSSGSGTPGLAAAGPYYSTSTMMGSAWLTTDLSTSPTSTYPPQMDRLSPLSTPMSYPAMPMSQPSGTPPGFHALSNSTYPAYAPQAGYHWDLGHTGQGQYQDVGVVAPAPGYSAPFIAYPGGRPWSSESGPSGGPATSTYSTLSNFQGQSRHHREYSA